MRTAPTRALRAGRGLQTNRAQCPAVLHRPASARRAVVAPTQSGYARKWPGSLRTHQCRGNYFTDEASARKSCRRPQGLLCAGGEVSQTNRAQPRRFSPTRRSAQGMHRAAGTRLLADRVARFTDTRDRCTGTLPACKRRRNACAGANLRSRSKSRQRNSHETTTPPRTTPR